MDWLVSQGFGKSMIGNLLKRHLGKKYIARSRQMGEE